MNVWQLFEDQQWDLYHEAWVVHLTALNAEVHQALGTLPAPGDLARIPHKWGTSDPSVGKEPVPHPRAGARAAAILVHEWLDCPDTFANPAGSPSRAPADAALADVEKAVTVVWRELTGNEVAVQLDSDVAARATREHAVAGNRPLPDPLTFATDPDWCCPQDFPTNFVPAGAAKKHMSRDLPRGSVTGRRRVRALVDAFALDTLASNGMPWTPRVLRHFPDFPWVASVQRGTAYYAQDCATRHGKWITELSRALELRSLTEELDNVRRLRKRHNAELLHAVLGCAAEDVPADDEPILALIHGTISRVVIRYAGTTGGGMASQPVRDVLQTAESMVGEGETNEAAKAILAWFADGRKANAERGALNRFHCLSAEHQRGVLFVIRGVLEEAMAKHDPPVLGQTPEVNNGPIADVEALLNGLIERGWGEQQFVAAAARLGQGALSDDGAVVGVAIWTLRHWDNEPDEGSIYQASALNLSQQHQVLKVIARAVEREGWDAP